MRRTVPALLALTLGLMSCMQAPTPQSGVSSIPATPAPAAVTQPAVTDPAAAQTTPPAESAPVEGTPADSGQTESAQALRRPSLVPDTYGQAVSVQNATLRVGNQSLFPFGFYHVSWMSDAATRQRDMQEMSAAGFNTMTASVINDADNARYGEFLDAAARARMYVLSEGVFESSVPKLATKPAVLGWMVADDCNLQYTPAQVRARGARMRALDPLHPTYAALFTSYAESHSEFFDTTHMMGNMSYPIGPGDSIGATYDMQRLSVALSKKNGTVPVANLQSFSWGTVPGHDAADPAARMPTPAEVYNMTYQAIGAGVRGILYYTYLDSYSNVRRSPAVWDMTRSIVPEIAQLSPMLLSAEPQYLETNNGNVHATAWAYQGHTYLLLTNISATQSQPLYVPLAAQRPTGLQPLFAGRGGEGVKLGGTTLGGTIAPLGAHFFRIN